MSLTRRKDDDTPGPDFVVQRDVPGTGRGAARVAAFPTDKGLRWMARLADEINAATGLQFNAVSLAALLREVMRLMREATEPKVAVYRLLLLLCVLEQPGIAQSDLGEVARLTLAGSASRNLRNLGTVLHNRQPGPDFVETSIDPVYRKKHRLLPTVKAHQWLETAVQRVNAKLLILKDSQ